MERYKIVLYKQNPITYAKEKEKVLYFENEKDFKNAINKYFSLKSLHFFMAYELINDEYLLVASY